MVRKRGRPKKKEESSTNTPQSGLKDIAEGRSGSDGGANPLVEVIDGFVHRIWKSYTIEEVQQDFPEIIHFTDEEGRVASQTVEYEWKPTICSKCKRMGHNAEILLDTIDRKGAIPSLKMRYMISKNVLRTVDWKRSHL
ncbi:hypothetical protein DM860_018272 [Cuscuta australis]|uniref:Uncharacterized protein n=1 Tax=Cuscuta australis TaxID=267555 RepID=A0A328DXL6_9ASTE|nr:hypothetical protein DM860_018272 [Cuscuta australis]